MNWLQAKKLMIEKTLIFLFLVVSCHGTSFAAAAKPDWRVEWEKTIAAAEKEGVVSIYIFEAGPLTEQTVQAFERAYPKIKVSQLRGRGNDLGPRLVTERRAGKYIADLFAGGKGTALSTLYAGKLLDPIKPILLLPEVLDETKWWRGTHKYVDPENKYIFVYIGNAGGVEINYNSKLVNPREFSSYWDLLQPKWKTRSSPSIRACAAWTIPCCSFTTTPNSGPNSSKSFTARWKFRLPGITASLSIGWRRGSFHSVFRACPMRWTRRWSRVYPSVRF